MFLERMGWLLSYFVQKKSTKYPGDTTRRWSHPFVPQYLQKRRIYLQLIHKYNSYNLTNFSKHLIWIGTWHSRHLKGVFESFLAFWHTTHLGLLVGSVIETKFLWKLLIIYYQQEFWCYKWWNEIMMNQTNLMIDRKQVYELEHVENIFFW
jgi:hypothetical protein